MELILYGNDRDKKLASPLYKALSSTYRTLYFNEKKLIGAQTPQICLLETSQKIQITSDNCLIVLKEHANLSNLKGIGHTPILVWSARKRQLETISRLKLSAIPCGLSEKDTFTFSSVAAQNSLICVQREFAGHAPMEIPAEHPENLSQFAILCMAAVTLMLEPNDELKMNLFLSKTSH